MPRRLIVTVVCFHITAALLVLAAIAVFAFFGPLGLIGGALHDMPRDMQGPGMPGGMGTMFGLMAAYVGIIGLGLLVSAAGVEVVIWALNKLEYWAWIVGIVICGLLIVSGLGGAFPNMILGGLGLWGLVDPESVKAFRPGNATGAPKTEG